jgi:NitT/TauT family transport system substrate-binding protein
MFRKFGLACFALILLAASASADTVKIGLQPWLGYGPLWVAKEKGFFEKRGVTVELTTFNWDQDMTAALASDNLNVIASATNGLITNFNQSIDQKGFLVMDVSFAADAVIAGGDIKSIADLKGKKIAFESGSTSDLLINYALNSVGMSIKDVEHVPMGAAEAGLAMIAGRVDAAVSYEPYISAALGQDAGKKVLYTAAEKPGLISDMLTAKADWITKNPDAVKGLILAWDDAINFIRENPEEGGAMIAKAVGSPMTEFEPAFKGVRFYNIEENVAFLGGDFQATIKTTSEILQTAAPDRIKKIPTPEDILMLDTIMSLKK